METETNLKQTGIKVKLIGEDGNAFNLLGIVIKALRRGGQSQEFVDSFKKEATSSDYNHLLATISEVVEVY